MANIKSAKKRVLVNQTKAANNKARNTALKTAIKKANAAIEANADDKEAVVKEAVKKMKRSGNGTGKIAKTAGRVENKMINSDNKLSSKNLFNK